MDYFDYDDSGYSDADDEFVELPEIVQTERDRRKELLKDGQQNEDIPVNEAALTALRAYFKTGGGQPFFYGSYMKLVEELGAKVDSTDPFVKDTRYNIWHVSFGGGGDNKEFWRNATTQHESKVRLIRYGEFLDAQGKRGLLLDEERCQFHKDEDDDNFYDFRNHGDDEDYRKDTSTFDDDDLTEEQLESLLKAFTGGFYYYCNYEKIRCGMGSGVTTSTTRGMILQQVEKDTNVIVQQCRELSERYNSQGRPLPGIPVPQTRDRPSFGSNNKKKKNRGKKKQQKGGGAGHAASIAAHIHELLQVLDQQFTTPTIPCAYLLYEVSMTLEAAVEADLEVARALAKQDDGKIILRLRERSLEFAKSADAMPSRSAFAADRWWLAFCSLTELVGKIVENLTIVGSENNFYVDSSTPDDILAAKFFEGLIAPTMLESVSAPLAAERIPSIVALTRAACGVPRDQSFYLVKEKKTWKVLEAACTVPACIVNGSQHAQKREDHMAPQAAAKATSMMANLCGRGMKLDDSPAAKTAVVPGELARKMIQRGIVPLLMSLSQSGDCVVAREAVSALSQLSRVKDCRQLMLQEPNGIQLVQDMMASTDGDTVSNAILLVVHLLWDEEWRDPILSIRPPIETTAIKWAAYSMKHLRQEASRIRAESEKKEQKTGENLVQKYLLRQGSLAREKLELEMDEDKAALENEVKWFELETDQYQQANSSIFRSLGLLSTMLHNKDAPDRLLRVNAPGLAAACLDVPIEDTSSAAAAMLHNLSTKTKLPPSIFPDPDHVLESIFSRFNRFADQQRSDQQTSVIVQLLSTLRRDRDWTPYFESLAERDEEAKFAIEKMLPLLMSAGIGRPASARARAAPVSQRGIHDECAAPTGKLKTCQNCGKMEGKRGWFKLCSICKVPAYCGRDCQVAHWKEHKKECAKLAKKGKK